MTKMDSRSRLMVYSIWDIKGKISLFVDGLKSMFNVNSEEQIQHMKNNLTKISEWAAKLSLNS